MFARMCLLEKIPGAFDSYIPPVGINVSWYWDFKGKENDNQVIAFFTAQEISVSDHDVHVDGNIKKEVENNRCFILVRTFPKAQWDKVIPDFQYQGQTITIPKMHAAVKDEWHPKQKQKIHKFKDKDGKDQEVIEQLEFESEIDIDLFNKMNEERHDKKLGSISVEPDKIRTEKKEGNKKPTQKVTIDYIKVIDEIKEEND